MKKNLRKLVLVTIMSLLGVSSFSQHNYWNGIAAGFEGTRDSAGTSNVSVGSGKTTSGVWFMDSTSGVFGWYLKNYYQTASASGLCATGQTKDIRMPKKGTAPGFGCLATPYLGFGVNTVSYLEGRGRKVSIFYTTTDTTVSSYIAAGTIPSNWTFVDSTTVSAKCVARTITINNPAATRIIFANLTTGDEDIDSIAITSVNVITPVKFGGISAAAANNVIKLNWNIETETNINSYIIERSSNGDNYSQVGTLNSNHSSNYNWIDYAPNSGSNFYRVIALDNNGVKQYSSIVRINISGTKGGLNIYPNPIKAGQLNVELSGINKGNYTVNVYSMTGALVHTSTLTSEGTSLSKAITLSSAVKNGNYTLEITNGSFKTTKLIFVQ